MLPIIYFVFYYVAVPYGAVISLGIFSCLAKRETIEMLEGTSTADCPLTKIWTWLPFFALLNTGVFRFYNLNSNAADLLSNELILGGSYLLTILVVAACTVFLVAWRSFFWRLSEK